MQIVMIKTLRKIKIITAVKVIQMVKGNKTITKVGIFCLEMLCSC